MKVVKKFKQTHVEGKCAKKLVTISHEDVIYTVVCDKSQYKTHFTPKQLRIYWDEGKDAESGWGQSFVVKIGVPFVHDDSEAANVGQFALTILGDAFA